MVIVMVSTYDLLDIYTILLLIRANPTQANNSLIVKDTIRVLWDKMNKTYKQDITNNISGLRNNISLENYTDSNIWSWGCFDDMYVETYDKKIVEAFYKIFNKLMDLLVSNNYTQAQKLCDDVHNFPIDLLVKNRNKIIIKLERFSKKM